MAITGIAILLCAGAGFAADDRAAAPAPAAAPSATAAPGDLEIQVRPRTVYRRTRYSLEVKGAAAAPGAVVRWRADGGSLAGDRGPRVVWKAPDSTGTVRISVEVTGEAATRRGEATVVVRQPSWEGMVRVPAGTFTMGDTWTDTLDPRYFPTSQNKLDKPAHPVHLDEYWIDRLKVTNRRYLAYLESALAEGILEVTPRYVVGTVDGASAPLFRFVNEESAYYPKRIPPLLKEITWDGAKFHVKPGCEDHPVVDVTWLGAVAFASYYGKRVPTEAEWEKAARGTDDRRYPWGNEFPTRHHANVNRYYTEPTPVGMFSPLGDSPYGACDMIGNCHEWVNDWFSDDIYADVSSDLPLHDPTGNDWGIEHVVKCPARLDAFTDLPAQPAPISWRYHWGFEFAYTDSFADAFTGFRTALAP